MALLNLREICKEESLNSLIVIQIFKFSNIICDTLQIAPDSTCSLNKKLDLRTSRLGIDSIYRVDPSRVKNYQKFQLDSSKFKFKPDLTRLRLNLTRLGS